jgi:cytochrome c peroxidase
MSKNLRRLMILAILATMLAALVLVGQGLAQPALTPTEALGQFLYFDQNLSDCSLVLPGEVCNPAGQSCASCHDPAFGFADPDRGLPVSEGVIFGRFGGRNSPSSAYAMYAPSRYFDVVEGLWIGGQFWDSRASGEVLGDPLADQALGPFQATVEMANPNKATVIADVAASSYAGLFEEVWGAGSLNDVEGAYDQVALSIAAFERTELFAPFSSKYDAYLQSCLAMGGDKVDCATGVGKRAKMAGKIFSKEEWYGMQLFMNPNNNNDGILVRGEGAMCVLCHVSDWTTDPGNVVVPVVVPAWSPDGSIPPMFTDFTYDNLGVPKSEHPLLVNNPVDLGLGPVVGDTAENGKFKVMTLRNIGLTAPYAHNGYFETLKEITHFYNTRDVPGSLKKGESWPPPEVLNTVNFDELGNLGLSDADEDALVEFMKTLSDGWTP